jgi:hypothetical protein
LDKKGQLVSLLPANLSEYDDSIDYSYKMLLYHDFAAISYEGRIKDILKGEIDVPGHVLVDNIKFSEDEVEKY